MEYIKLNFEEDVKCTLETVEIVATLKGWLDQQKLAFLVINLPRMFVRKSEKEKYYQMLSE